MPEQGAQGAQGAQAQAASRSGFDSALEAQVKAIASTLRCPVCQNLSIEDSPSELAREMRDLIRERLLAGDTPEQVRAYFVSRYGEWVLLKPPARGFNLTVWIVPVAAVLAGIGIVVSVVRRWTGRRTERAVGTLDEEELARVRREFEEFEARGG
ncbi:MAG: cytochrome c-type biogenesis protein CcmH [Gemmatimonadetes bacterium]|nr:cytochrome c-type biogenesis protein CcmH [Gemmatimonadota bacterium]